MSVIHRDIHTQIIKQSLTKPNFQTPKNKRLKTGYLYKDLIGQEGMDVSDIGLWEMEAYVRDKGFIWQNRQWTQKY